MPLTSFKGTSQYGNALLSQAVEFGLISYFNWSFLGIGAFDNITLGLAAPYGGNKYTLQTVHDPYFNDGQVWQSFRANWVWETGIGYQYQPISISGVYLNNTFYPTSTTGQYSYYLDYPNGRVVFNNPQTGTLNLEYSYRNVYVTNAEEPWFKEIMFNSYRADFSNFTSGSGIYSRKGMDRLQLPAVVVEVVPNVSAKPYALGGGHWIDNDVLFHVFAETKYDADNIHDTIFLQVDSTFYSLDINQMIQNNVFPLDVNGSLAPSGLQFPQLLQNPYIYCVSYWQDVRTQQIGSISQRLYGRQIRATIRSAVAA